MDFLQWSGMVAGALALAWVVLVWAHPSWKEALARRLDEWSLDLKARAEAQRQARMTWTRVYRNMKGEPESEGTLVRIRTN